MPRMQEDISNKLDLVSHLHNLVREHPDFAVLCEPASHLYCFRYVPNGLAEQQDEPKVQQLLDHLNVEIVDAVQREGFALLTMPHVNGCVAIRIPIFSQTTLREVVDATFEAIARWGRLLLRELSVRNGTPDMEAQLCSNESHSSPMEVSAT
jgi:aromatic-L-amino-acid/L-tryptophan decarboxylase